MLTDDDLTYLRGVVHALRRGARVTFMCGAGISTSAGIPDYRSNTGLWTRLGSAIDAETFRTEPERLFHTLASVAKHWVRGEGDAKEVGETKEAEGACAPTAAHAMMKEAAGVFDVQVFTQNVDGLEIAAGLDPARVHQLHGSIRMSRCTRCRKTSRTDLRRLAAAEPAWCAEPGCTAARERMRVNHGDRVEWGYAFERRISMNKMGLLRPNVVLLGERIRLQRSPETIRFSNLLIVMGTSLRVHPFAEFVRDALAHTDTIVVDRDPEMRSHEVLKDSSARFICADTDAFARAMSTLLASREDT